MIDLSGADFIKLGPLVAVIWFLWFDSRDVTGVQRERLVRCLIGVLAAVLLARAAQNFLPYRPRPMFAELEGFRTLAGFKSALRNWSSMPSDHAVISFALAAVIFHGSRVFGILAFIWAAAVVCLPRFYLGLHYLSDLIGGALLGLVVLECVSRLPPMARLSAGVLAAETRWRGLFYAAAFLFTAQMVTLFGGLRLVVRAVAQVVGAG